MKQSGTRHLGKFEAALALALLLTTLPASAGIIIGSHTWDEVSQGLMGWQSTYGSSQLSRQGSGGHPAGWLDISFPAIDPFSPPGTNWYDLVYAPATNLFAGTWTSNMFVKFDFWSGSQTPNRLAVRWQSITNSYVWSHSMSVSSTQTWDSMMAGFGDWQDWILGPGASEDMFLSDLSSIEWIGIYVERNGAGAQDYGLDNFNLMVPEPSQYAMLAAALMGAWIFLRRRPLRAGDSG